MLDADQVGAALRNVLLKYPAVEPYLRRVGERVAKTGVLHGRMKLGERLPHAAMQGLWSVFANTALETKPDGATYLRLERTNIAEEDAVAWIIACCAVFDLPRGIPASARQRATADAAVLLDRCRLQFPELFPVWDDQTARGTELASLVMARTLAVVQQEYRQLATATRFLLSDHEPLGMADLSARCFGDSKVLKLIRSLGRRLEEWLLLLRDEEIDEGARRRIWAEYGVVENATAIKVTLYGPLIYFKHGERFDWIAQLHARGETATLSWDNLRGIDAIALPPGTPVITCENETPFSALLREGIPGLLIYTAGYPNSAVSRIVHLLPKDTTIQHWGDSDPDGLRIAAMLRQLRPVQLWRCNLAEVQRHQTALLPLAPDRQRKAVDFLANHPEFPFSEEFAFTIAQGWLEQERWKKKVARYIEFA